MLSRVIYGDTNVSSSSITKVSGIRADRQYETSINKRTHCQCASPRSNLFPLCLCIYQLHISGAFTIAAVTYIHGKARTTSGAWKNRK